MARDGRAKLPQTIEMGANHLPSLTRRLTRVEMIHSLLNLHKYTDTTLGIEYTTLEDLYTQLDTLEYHELQTLLYKHKDEVDRADSIHDKRMKDLH